MPDCSAMRNTFDTAPMPPATDSRDLINSLDMGLALSKKKFDKALEQYQGRLNLLTRDADFRERSLIVVFEGQDAAGKGSAIRRITGALDARHYQVIPIAAPSQVAELKDGEVRVYSIAPEDFGIARSTIDDLRVASPAESLAIVRRVLGGEAGAAADFVALNAGAALYAADRADSLADGIAAARTILASGQALGRLQHYVALTHRL